jgi:hypothetical protein
VFHTLQRPHRLNESQMLSMRMSLKKQQAVGYKKGGI